MALKRSKSLTRSGRKYPSKYLTMLFLKWITKPEKKLIQLKHSRTFVRRKLMKKWRSRDNLIPKSTTTPKEQSSKTSWFKLSTPKWIRGTMITSRWHSCRGTSTFSSLKRRTISNLPKTTGSNLIRFQNATSNQILIMKSSSRKRRSSKRSSRRFLWKRVMPWQRPLRLYSLSHWLDSPPRSRF